jgi:hypothetical protein
MSSAAAEAAGSLRTFAAVAAVPARAGTDLADDAAGIESGSGRAVRCWRALGFTLAPSGAVAAALRPRAGAAASLALAARVEPLESEPGSDVSAQAVPAPENAAAPTPSATAKPPTRPTNREAPMPFLQKLLEPERTVTPLSLFFGQVQRNRPGNIAHRPGSARHQMEKSVDPIP